MDNNLESEEIPVKMYFTTNEIKKDILTKDNSTTEYIILQNNKLHAYVKDLERKLNECETEKKEAEDEVDSLTKSRTCLQGYMKNELEYAENWKKVANIYNTQLKRYTDIAVTSLFLNLFYIVLLSVCPYSIRIKLTLTTMYITMMTYYCGMNLYNIYYHHTKHHSLIDVKKEITKIEKSNLYIMDLIDNI